MIKTLLSNHSYSCNKLFNEGQTTCSSVFIREDGTKIEIVTTYKEVDHSRDLEEVLKRMQKDVNVDPKKSDELKVFIHSLQK